MCVWAGIVFQLLPGASNVKPITNWQLLIPSR